MRLLLWIGLLVGPFVPWAGAAPTDASDVYFVGIKDGYGPLRVKGLCFAADSAYFVNLKDSSKSFLPLSAISLIRKDTRKSFWIGAGIGFATYVVGTLVLWDEKAGYFLPGLLLAPGAAVLGGMLGHDIGSETLFNSRDIGSHQARRLELGCHDSAVAADRRDSREFQNLKTDLDRKVESDGLVMQGLPGKNRLEITTGLGIAQQAETPVENWRLAGTRILKVMDGTTGTVSLAFSQTKRPDTTGHTYEVGVAMGAGRQLVPHLFGYFQTGTGMLYAATEPFFDESDAFGLDLFLSFGLLANFRQTFLLGEVSHYSMASTLKMRVGAGWWY
jgi:hypothetical protein